MYSVCITPQEYQLLQACVLGCVRRIQVGAPEREAINFTTAAAEALTRLNEARIDHTDVKFFCTCIEKTITLLHRDDRAPQRAAVVSQLHQLQNKLGENRGTLPNIRHDGERENDAGEAPSATLQS